MPIHTGRLLLTPTDPWLVVDPHALRTALDAMGFIGPPLPPVEVPGGPRARPPEPSNGFLVGARFFNLLVFAGCAVNLRLTPEATGEPFTHIYLVGPLASPLLLRGRNTRPPRCPSCRAPGRALFGCHDQHQDLDCAPGRAMVCPACGSRHPLWFWDWKGRAGFGRCFVWVEEVFPGEAEPTPEFHAALANLTNSPWRHFYVQD